MQSTLRYIMIIDFKYGMDSSMLKCLIQNHNGVYTAWQLENGMMLDCKFQNFNDIRAFVDILRYYDILGLEIYPVTEVIND